MGLFRMFLIQPHLKYIGCFAQKSSHQQIPHEILDILTKCKMFINTKIALQIHIKITIIHLKLKNLEETPSLKKMGYAKKKS